MSRAEAIQVNLRSSFPVDLGWRNFVFALRTAVAGVAALAVSYWLGLQDPQWSILTVYLLAQPTTGAVLAKGAYRIVGTLVGALWGLVALALYAEAAAPFVLTMVVWLGLCIYAAARLRNFVSYGFLLAGYTALLVGYEGAAAPTAAWMIAVDRSAEIVIGIACTAAVSVLIMPRHAGEVLRTSLAATFSGLASYGAAAMRPTTPIDSFVALRRRMVGEVVQFDALRSYTRFESSEMRVDDGALRRVLREFLSVLAVARGLYFRLEDFHKEEGGMILERVGPALEGTAACLERIAADPGAVANPHRTRRELLAARGALGAAADELGALIGKVSLDPLANGLLIIQRAGDMLHGLSMVMVTEEATLLATARGRRPRRWVRLAPSDQRGAVLQGLRAALALLIVSIFWGATAWSAGFSAIVGLAVMLFVLVNQEDPGRLGWPYLVAVTLALIAAFAAMMLVLPRLEGFDSLAVFLIVALLPAGLLIGTPRFALIGAGFGAFFVSEIGTGNLFQPAPQAYMNNAVGLVIGMAACLVVAVGLMPINAPAARRAAWAAMMRALPAAARGERPERAVAGDVLAILGGLLPRLDLDKPGDETFLRGSLGAASTSMELWRLHDRKDDPAMPPAAREALSACLDRLAAAYTQMSEDRGTRSDIVADAEAAVSATRAALATLQVAPGSPAARLVLRAAASLRFIGDRFGIDRPFLLRSFDSA
jgi:uncharacterized membrane protein YccC